MTNLLDYIFHRRGVLPHSLCDRIVEYTDIVSDRWVEAKTIYGDNDRRRSLKLILNSSDPVDGEVFPYVAEAMELYHNMFPHMAAGYTRDSGYEVLKYKVGDRHGIHTDAHSDLNRELTIILNLSDGYSGGELVFHLGSEKYPYSLGKGDVIVFPGNFMFPHSISPITEGVRHSIVTWTV